jgi:putative transposase
MNLIDTIYTRRPYYGYPRITKELNKRHGEKVNHKRIARLMRLMGIQAIYPKPDTSKPGNSKNHTIYPYLLKGVSVARPNHAWGVDITYIRLVNDWLYLVVIMDWYSRYIVSWELSDQMSVDFCICSLEKALHISQPDIHNSDQGSQFTSKDYLSVLQRYPNIRISMDGRGRAFDNIFVERLWRTIKYEEVYIKDYQSPREARQSLCEYITFYNNERFHSSLNDMTPAEVYFNKNTRVNNENNSCSSIA